MNSYRWQNVIEPLLSGKRRATQYLSPSLVIKAARRHKPRRNERTVEIVLTVGKPNYAEREFIKLAKKSGELFPVKRVQFKEWRAA